ncbi:MAG: hypothetical protein ACT4PL_10155, partial [Phycisphaerales bacterium]
GGAGSRGIGGRTYGSVSNPALSGSGGGSFGGFGGGVVRISAAGPAMIDGEVIAHGVMATGGGGAGGSVRLDCGPISGSGLIAANGGNSGNSNRGGGGGGRVAVYHGGDAGFSGAVRAYAGLSNDPGRNGGPGTVYRKEAGIALGTIVIENTTTLGEAAILNGEQFFEASLVVRPGGKLSHDVVTPLLLELEGGITVHEGGVIDVSGRGHGPGAGPGASPPAPFSDAGGAGYGGAGAPGSRGPGGVAYGLADLPLDLGSGGSEGGGGGGSLVLLARQPVIVNGAIRGDGTNGNGGGGSGGSLVVIAPQVAGIGTLSVNGGLAGNVNRGGGGGGRLAVYTCNLQLPMESITATGAGVGIRRGQDGTIRLGSGTIDVSEQPVAEPTYVGGATVVLRVMATTSQMPAEIGYRWRRNGVPLMDGDFEGRLSGTGTAEMTIVGGTCRESGVYDCLLTDACGSFPSFPALVSIQSGAEFNGDGVLTPDDLDDFITAFFTIPQPLTVDFNRDGIIEPGDLDDFITAFFEGCG